MNAQPIHPYFLDKAREVFRKAGGDPDSSTELARWAEAAKAGEPARAAAGEPQPGIVVAQDGTLVATTTWRQANIGARYYVDEILVPCVDEDRKRMTGYAVRDHMPGLGKLVGGQPCIEVRYWEICTGASRLAPQQ